MNKQALKIYLKKMTDIALEYNIIISESLHASSYTYDHIYGPKLYWNIREYVFKMPDGSILSAKDEL